MYEQDAIDVNDFVFAATGARVRRLTLAEGEHWFPAADVAKDLGYTNTRQALLWHVAEDCQQSLEDLARSVYGADALSKIAGHGLKKSMKMVNLQGLIRLVNGCTKPECEPFKAWVAEVVVTIQRDGCYELEPAPVQPAPGGGVGYVVPQQVADAIVRLEERNIRADEEFAARAAARNELLAERNSLIAEGNRLAAQREQLMAERNQLLRESNGDRSAMARNQDAMARSQEMIFRSQEVIARSQEVIARSQDAMATALGRMAESLDRIAGRMGAGGGSRKPPVMTPQELLAGWQARNLVVTADVHAVAAYLAPALVRGKAQYRLEDIAGRTGLTVERVHDSVRMLLKRGCMKQSGCAADGAPVYVLP
ncbi:Bro-N domain-containing protein [Streptomyces olivochromogenes]|uniref:BRO-N domain-containing protein n=1 Tax=Streptomyces olivochromogenes TaxID=1963 RepID=UPI0036D7B58D